MLWRFVWGLLGVYCMCLQAREAGRLLQDKQALESRLKEMERILATVQDQRNELKQQYKARGLADVSMQLHYGMWLATIIKKGHEQVP